VPDEPAPPNAPAQRPAAGPSPSDLSFRASLGWTALGTILPGLGLWKSGHRLAGGVVLGLFAVLVAGVGGFWLVDGELLRSVVLQSGMLQNLAIALVVVAVAWVGVIGVSHLALRPARPSVGQRAAGAGVVGVLAFAVAAPLAFAANLSWTAGELFDSLLGTDEVPNATQPTINTVDPWKDKARLNFLILGGDSGTHRDTALGDRTDTVIVASIDTHTGATTLFTLPRNTEKTPFPADSPLHRYYPYGFTKPGAIGPERNEYLLNAMYRNVPNTVPRTLLGKTRNLGADVVKVAVGEALGLKLDYYVLVNMDGFKDFVNAIGGVTVNINYRIPIGGKKGPGYDIPPSGWLEPGPNQKLKGHDALWYARGRYDLDDYKRMERQRCVINAVVRQSTPGAVLSNFQSIAKAGEHTIQTDVPRSLLPALLELGTRVKGTPLRSVVFITGENGFRSYDPDWKAVRARVRKALKETASGVAAAADPSPTGSATPGRTKTQQANSGDLQDVCGYHPEKA
jgi:polyisoprenyl-teichoic acid--peptidoglycan teichoic acid transferase